MEAAAAYDTNSLRHNAVAITYCRTGNAILTGFTAGTLGLTSWKGFVLYAITSLLLSILISLRVGGNAKKYFRSWTEVWFDGVLGNLVTFILFWTMLTEWHLKRPL
eukprot:m.561246 g.561246  ORF g.561246 m.561246 type:complete len:106 (+) comp57795_c1_seq1:2555-2872(+)